MIEAEFINLGRDRVNKTVKVENERELQKEIGKYLLSKGWELHDTDTPNLYSVTAGFHSVGSVKILK